ncbi:hypothetical protein ABE10_00955, partial [Bacillus toyonensis]|nr:hypothetical protein [Bacillus toyonensis]
MSVDVRQGQALRDHEDLEVVKQLRDLLGRGLVALVLGRHPHLGRLFDDLLADRVDPAVELTDGARALRAFLGLAAQFREEFVEGFHPSRLAA